MDTPYDAVALREAMWLHHGHDGLYGDDGEMQCNRYPPTDFKRDDIDALIVHLNWSPISAAVQEDARRR